MLIHATRVAEAIDPTKCHAGQNRDCDLGSHYPYRQSITILSVPPVQKAPTPVHFTKSDREVLEPPEYNRFSDYGNGMRCWHCRWCVDRCQPDLHKLDRCRTSPQPPSHGDQRPNCLKHSERPRPLQESVSGTEDTGCREGKNENSAAILQCVADQHCGNR